MIGAVVRFLLRVGLAAVYMIAAVPKIIDPWDFARAIRNFRIVPLDAVPTLAVALPPLEALAGLAVLTGVMARGGLVWLAGLSLAFAAGIVSAMIRGLDIDCGCFGHLARSSANIPHLALNVGCAAAAIILLASLRRRRRRR